MSAIGSTDIEDLPPAPSGATSAVFPGAQNSTTYRFTAAQVVEASGGAPIASPDFTGEPTAPTPPTGDNSNRIATTAFVDSAIVNPSSGTAPFTIGDPTYEGKALNIGAGGAPGSGSGSAEFSLQDTGAPANGGTWNFLVGSGGSSPASLTLRRVDDAGNDVGVVALTSDGAGNVTFPQGLPQGGTYANTTSRLFSSAMQAVIEGSLSATVALITTSIGVGTLGAAPALSPQPTEVFTNTPVVATVPAATMQNLLNAAFKHYSQVGGGYQNGSGQVNTAGITWTVTSGGAPGYTSNQLYNRFVLAGNPYGWTGAALTAYNAIQSATFVGIELFSSNSSIAGLSNSARADAINSIRTLIARGQVPILITNFFSRTASTAYAVKAYIDECYVLAEMFGLLVINWDEIMGEGGPVIYGATAYSSGAEYQAQMSGDFGHPSQLGYNNAGTNFCAPFIAQGRLREVGPGSVINPLDTLGTWSNVGLFFSGQQLSGLGANFFGTVGGSNPDPARMDFPVYVKEDCRIEFATYYYGNPADLRISIDGDVLPPTRILNSGGDLPRQWTMGPIVRRGMRVISLISNVTGVYGQPVPTWEQIRLRPAVGGGCVNRSKDGELFASLIGAIGPTGASNSNEWDIVDWAEDRKLNTGANKIVFVGSIPYSADTKHRGITVTPETWGMPGNSTYSRVYAVRQGNDLALFYYSNGVMSAVATATNAFSAYAGQAFTGELALANSSDSLTAGTCTWTAYIDGSQVAQITNCPVPNGYAGLYVDPLNASAAPGQQFRCSYLSLTC